MRICSKCKELKDDSCFYAYDDRCRECFSRKAKKYRHSLKGLVHIMYNAQKGSSKIRGHDKPNYTVEQLEAWLFANDIESLYDEWKISGFKKMLRPSVDRLDDFKGYDLTNIRLVTWAENLKKQNNDLKNGTGKTGLARCKPVLQITIDGAIINRFFSAKEASRQLGISYKNISEVCKNNRKTAGNYKWRFENENK